MIHRCCLLTGLFALGVLLPGSAAAGTGAGADAKARLAFDQARKRADLQHSLVKGECQRLDAEMRDACLAKAKDTHAAALAEARKQNGLPAETLDAPTQAAYDEEIEHCNKSSGKVRDSCIIDTKLRFRQ